MILYITRHGQPLVKSGREAAVDPDYPPGDPPLSALGREQARRLGLRLKDQGFEGRIYASPYRRTMETADVIAGLLGSVTWPVPALREYTGPNIHTFQGGSLEQLRALFPTMALGASLAYPWWTLQEESVDDQGLRPNVMKRVGAFIETLMAVPGQDALLVGHGASTSAAARWLHRKIPGHEPFPDKPGWNCTYTAIRLHPEIEFLAFRDITHLDPEQVTSNSRAAAETGTETGTDTMSTHENNSRDR